MNPRKDDGWKEAKRRCRLNEEDIRMAKELGFQPRSLIKSIPNRSQKWKAPVNEWIRSLYEEEFGALKTATAPIVLDETGIPDLPFSEFSRIDDMGWVDEILPDEDPDQDQENTPLLR